jgi:hypothetical protein
MRPCWNHKGANMTVGTAVIFQRAREGFSAFQTMEWLLGSQQKTVEIRFAFFCCSNGAFVPHGCPEKNPPEGDNKTSTQNKYRQYEDHRFMLV